MSGLTVELEEVVTGGIKRAVKKMPWLMDVLLLNVSKEQTRVVQREFLSGQVLRSVTGKTRGSIFPEKVREGVYQVRAGKGIPGRLNYLKIFATGGTIRPKKGRFLRFYVDGQVVFARSVRISPRPFFKPAAQRMRGGPMQEVIRRTYAREEEKWLHG